MLINWLISLPPFIGGTLFTAIAVVFGLATYAIARFAVGRHATEESKTLVIQLFRVIATLLSLLLSMTFADVRSETEAVRNSVRTETAQLSDIYKDLTTFGTSEAEAVRTQLVEYIDAVIGEEWDAMRHGDVSEPVIVLFSELEIAILSLEPTTPLQGELHRRLNDDIDAVSSSRTARLVQLRTGIPVFLYIAFIGFLWTNAMLSVSPPEGKTVFYIGAYCAFFGIVIYFILAMGNHFDGIGEVTPDALEFVSGYFKKY